VKNVNSQSPWLRSAFCLILGVLLAGTGCRTPVRPSVSMNFRPTRGVMWLDSPVLVLTPVANESLHDDLCRRFGEHFALEMTKFTESQVVYSEQVHGLRGRVTWENIAGVGNNAPEEALAMAAVTNCRSVVAIRLLAVSTYAPQRLAIHLRWWDAEDGTLIQQTVHDLNLADREVRNLYAMFVDDYGFFRHNASKLELNQFDTALYSPNIFHRFASVIATQALVRAVPVETTPVSQKWANSLQNVLQKSKLAQFLREDN